MRMSLLPCEGEHEDDEDVDVLSMDMFATIPEVGGCSYGKHLIMQKQWQE